MTKILKPLVVLLHWVLMWIHDGLASVGVGEQWTWGLAIIGLTVIVRTLMFPLTWKQYQSTRAMQALQPLIKELQRKYKDNREKLQQETMRLYSEHKVNPFASCLPLLIQMPVFFALYYAIRGTGYLPAADTKALSDAAFLWIPSLGNPDPYRILLIIYVVTQLISTELTLTPQTETSQKWLMRGMPIFFVFLLFKFPSGLFVYWVTTNLWTIGQQLIIRRAMPIVPIEATAGAGGGKGGKGGKAAEPPKKKRGRFMEAMMAAQEQAEAQREEKRKAAQGGSKASGAKGAGAKKAAAKGGKAGAKKGGKRPPPGKRVKPRQLAPEIDDNDAPPPYR